MRAYTHTHTHGKHYTSKSLSNKSKDIYSVQIIFLLTNKLFEERIGTGPIRHRTDLQNVKGHAMSDVIILITRTS